MSEVTKTLFQCDFDGTITEEDVSFILLDTFADGDWRRLLREFQEGKMTVGRFNTDAFALIKADRESLLAVARSQVKIRPGFQELLDCCRRKSFRFVIVSNGLDFYIEEILNNLGIADIEVISAQTRFSPGSLKVEYIDPDGNHLDNDFKEAYTSSFLREDYRILYAGNGESDLAPARRCHSIFATGTLLKRCQETNVDCVAFTDFATVVKVLESL